MRHTTLVEELRSLESEIRKLLLPYPCAENAGINDSLAVIGRHLQEAEARAVANFGDDVSMPESATVQAQRLIIYRGPRLWVERTFAASLADKTHTMALGKTIKVQTLTEDRFVRG